ncbi:MAG: cytochrome b [Rickettsiales bacterium]
MQWKNTLDTYGAVAKTFHWVVALLVIGLLCVGFYMTGAERTLGILKLYGLHKSVGLVVLSAVILRILWRLINKVPPLPAGTPAWQRWGAHFSHYGLYALIFAQPVIGWMMSSAAGFTVSVFGLFAMPDLIGPDKDAFETLRFLHWLCAWALIVLISLHVLAALQHHFLHKDNVLLRMIPYGKLRD